MSIDEKLDQTKNKEAQQSKREKRESRRKKRMEELQKQIISRYDEVAQLEKELFLYEDPWGYYRKFHKGTPRKKLSRICPPLYAIFKDRGEINRLHTKRRFFENDDAVMNYYAHAFPGYTSGKVWKSDPTFHEVMRRRGLLAKIPPYAPWPPEEQKQITENSKQEI